MGGRQELRTGACKDLPIRAGPTFSVAPDSIPGTFDQGLAHYRSLPLPFNRAVFMMFLAAEAHPFAERPAVWRGLRTTVGAARLVPS